MAFPPPGAVPPPFMPGAAGFPVMNMGVGMPTSGASPGGPGGPGLLAVPPQMAMSPGRWLAVEWFTPKEDVCVCVRAHLSIVEGERTAVNLGYL